MKMTAVRVVTATIALYVTLLIIPEKIIGIGIMVGYVGALFAIVRNLPQTLITAYVVFLPLSLGKFFPIDLVSAESLHLLNRPLGISADITITVRDLLVMLMAIELIRTRALFFSFRHNGLARLLFALPFVFGVSSVFGSMRPDISLCMALFYIEPFILYQYGRRFGTRVSVPLLFVSAAVAVIGESLIHIAQYIHGHSLGLIVENFPGYVPVDVSTDAIHVLRFGGTFSHANALAHYLTMFIFLLTPIISSPFSVIGMTGFIAVCLAVISLILTLSRSAWVAAVVAGIYLWVSDRHVLIAAARSNHTRRILPGIVIAILIYGLILAFPRLQGTLHTMEPYGSGITRILLYDQAAHIIREHPVFGVGLGLDTYAFYERSRASHIPLVSYFPDPVQNGLVQLFMQTGVVGLLWYVSILAVLLAKVFRGKNTAHATKKPYIVGVLVSYIAALVHSQFQPFLPDIGLFVLCTALLT